MKKILILLFLLIAVRGFAADSLFVQETQIPILIERADNVLFRMKIWGNEGQKLNSISLTFGGGVKILDIDSVKLYYSGTCARQDEKKDIFAPVNYMPFEQPKTAYRTNLDYSILKDAVRPKKTSITLNANTNLFPGQNFFWVSIKMKPKTSILSTFTSSITSATVDGKPVDIDLVSPKNIVHRMGVGVCHAGDFKSNAFRIPGLATTNDGVLIGVFDVRYNSSKDMQENIEVGARRSLDGGQTWGKLTFPLSFANEGSLPKAQNGVGDPSILVDRSNNKVWVIAAWSYGMGNAAAWWSTYPGMDKTQTAQLVLSSSTDNGATWSKPINITQQVKNPSWYYLLQGPGNGITMQDGTLVFPIQFIKEDREPAAGIMYSKDHGTTWHLHNYARRNTTEAQVAEIEPGVLMLNMRDNRGGSRAVAITKDLGKTWEEHPSSRSALRESICQASLIKVPAKDNVLGKDLLIFSNPDTTKGRHHITIKVSLDNGLTWLPENQLLLDEGDSWGYSCLSMVNPSTLGILYEGSTAEITFQAIPLQDIVKLK